jgi:hypothetical protein
LAAALLPSAAEQVPRAEQPAHHGVPTTAISSGYKRRLPSHGQRALVLLQKLAEAPIDEAVGEHRRGGEEGIPVMIEYLSASRPSRGQ